MKYGARFCLIKSKYYVIAHLVSEHNKIDSAHRAWIEQQFHADEEVPPKQLVATNTDGDEQFREDHPPKGARVAVTNTRVDGQE